MGMEWDFNIQKLLHPVGSIYMTFAEDNPANLFGGQWEKIANDAIISCAGTSLAANALTGSSTHVHQLSDKGAAAIWLQMDASAKTVTWSREGTNLPNDLTSCNYIQIKGGAASQSGVFATPQPTRRGPALVGYTDEETTSTPYVKAYVWKRIG